MFKDNPYKHCVIASTFDEYKAMPLQSREQVVWYWPCPLYIKPYALRAGQDELIGEWTKFDEYVKKKYPAQYFFRDTVDGFFWDIRHYFKRIKSKVRPYIKYPRKEMRDKVFTRKYFDLDSIIVKFCLQCVIEYVDRERCFDHILFDSSEDDKTFAAQLKECHTYAMKGRQEILTEIEKAWEAVPLVMNDIVQNKMDKYNKVVELEAKLVEADTQVCEWVVKNRRRLWT
jgi:hypothetical protein